MAARAVLAASCQRLAAASPLLVRPGAVAGLQLLQRVAAAGPCAPSAAAAFPPAGIARTYAAAAAPRDPYTVLGVARSASAEDIKKAYRREALKWHPDRHQSSEAEKATAEERFKEISQAYQTLSNSGQRAQYDAGGFQGGGAQSSSSAGGRAWQEEQMRRAQQQWQRQRAANQGQQYQQFYQRQYSREEADRVFRDMFGNTDVLRQMEEMARRMHGARGGGLGGARVGGMHINPEELDALLRGVFGGGAARRGPFGGGMPGGFPGFGGQSFGTEQQVTQEMYTQPNGDRVIRTTTTTRHSNGQVDSKVDERVVGNISRSGFGAQSAQQGGADPHDFSRNRTGRTGGAAPPPTPSFLGAIRNYVVSRMRETLFAMLGVIIRRVATAILQRIFKR